MGPRMAHAALGRIPGRAQVELRRFSEHRVARGGFDHGRLLPLAFHEGVSVGAPRYRGNGVEVGRREGRYRATGSAALALPGPTRGVTRIDFYHYADDKLRFACRLA